MTEKNCEVCNEKFKGPEEITMCPNCTRKKGTKNYYTIAILIILIGFVGGFIMGASSTNSDAAICWIIYCTIGSILFSIFVFGIHSICHRLDIIIDKLDSNKK